jgi:peptidoglycan/xylan/chitin deacetylase (PgdA/CDA1 family)
MKRTMLAVAFVSVSCSSSDDPPKPDDNSDPEPTTVVSLTFDDTRENQFQVGAIVAARQMRATFYVNSPRIGRTHYMSLDQLRELAAAGNEIGGHTLEHLNLADLDSDAAQREVCDDRVALLALGFEVSTLAYPFGSETAGVRRIAELCGYNAGRDSTGLALGANCVNCPTAVKLPLANDFAIPAAGSVSPATTLADLQKTVLDTEASGGGWVPFVFHHVCDNCSTNAISPSTLTAFVDWLAERKATGTGVRTVNEVLAGDVKPGVKGPLPGASASLITNGSLENDAEGNQVPDCFVQRASGNNEATFAMSNTAYQGTRAQQIAISSYADGSRRLFTSYDCPLPVHPGRSYRVTGYYFADTAPRFGVYYRTTTGEWKSFEQGPLLPVSPTYVQGVHTTAPLPDDATAISVGLGISGVGSITMDSFDAIDASGAADNTPPTVALTGPAEGSVVSSAVTFGANAADPDGIARVDFRINDKLQDFDESAPFELQWDPTGLKPGTYVVMARAWDRAGKVSTSIPLTITVGAN